jgi:hypothetical protein
MRRVWILAGAFAAAGVIFGLVLFLGDWAFDYRRHMLHQGRMTRVVQQEPTVERLTAGLAEEGAFVLAAPSSPDEVEQAIAAHGGGRGAEIREKAGRWGHLTVYRASDMLYFVFSDDERVVRDFTCVGG